MCGIAGYLGENQINPEFVNRTLKLMKNRGPNFQDFKLSKFYEKNLLLLHSRLSIIDLDNRSNQPFIKDDLLIIFNGEIYNYVELKTDLKKKGHIFKTLSDTEVILEMYKRYNEQCVNFFEGMWSFLIFDIKKKKIFLSRDRFGEKPLYYFRNENSFWFGSEPKFIFSLMNRSFELNKKKISKFLVCGFRSLYKNRETYYLNLKELEPGTNIIIEKDSFSKKKYWNVKFKPKNYDLEFVQEKVEDLLYKSLEKRLRADVPISFCLSGGVDSSCIAAIAQKKFNTKIHTFSVIDDDKRYDESENIQLIVNHLDCEHTQICTSKKKFISRMETIIDYFDAPIPTLSYYIHNFLSEEIKDSNYKVVISGTGADEIFTGYYDHYSFWLSTMAKKKDFQNLLKDRNKGYGKYINNPLLKDPFKIINKPTFRDHLYQDAKKFQKLIIGEYDFEFKEKSFSKDVLRNRMINELTDEIVPVILFCDDMNSMMNSLENRSPYLDRDLVEFLFSVPSKFLIKNGFQKWLLRQVAKKYLPDAIAFDKKKVGFNASIHSLLDLNCRDTKDWLLSESDIFEIIDKKKIEILLNDKFKSNVMSKFLFNFISTKIFMDKKYSFN